MPLDQAPQEPPSPFEGLLHEINTGAIERAGGKTTAIEAGEDWEASYTPQFRMLSLGYEFNLAEISFHPDGSVQNITYYDRKRQFIRTNLPKTVIDIFIKKAIELHEADKIPLPHNPAKKAA